MLDEFLVGGLLTLRCELAGESLYWRAVALRSTLFGVVRVHGRVPLPQGILFGVVVLSPAQVAGAPSKG